MTLEASHTATELDIPSRPRRQRNALKPGPRPGNRHIGQYLPGESGNPSGRPKKTEQQRTFEQMVKAATPKAVEVLEACLSDTGASWKERHNAAIAIIEFSEGRAVDRIQIATLNGTGNNVRMLPKSVLDRKVANLISQDVDLTAEFEEVTDV